MNELYVSICLKLVIIVDVRSDPTAKQRFQPNQTKIRSNTIRSETTIISANQIG